AARRRSPADRGVPRADRRSARLTRRGDAAAGRALRADDASPGASLPAPDPSSRPSARDARGYVGEAAAARRVLLRERSAAARGRARGARALGGGDLGRREVSDDAFYVRREPDVVVPTPATVGPWDPKL